MKILFDHQIFALQRYGGVSKYFFEILSNLPREEWDSTVLFSNNEYYKSLNLRYLSFCPQKKIKGIYHILNELNKPYTLWRILTSDCDVIHLTHFNSPRFFDRLNKPVVVTFHDMNFSLWDKNEYLAKLQRNSVDKADKIVCVSNNTKNDLVNMWGVPDNKIQVIYHGVSSIQHAAYENGRIVEYPYILYVGQRKTFKNFNRLVRAFKNITSNNKDLKLVCTNLPFTAEEYVLFKELDIIDRVISISASEVQMANLYYYAELFVYPSIYEGFGMPILEAMSYSCPTVIANASCFPEIAGDAAMYFDPLNIDEMTEAIKLLLNDDALKSKLIEKGLLLCNKFTWKKSAQEHRELYTKML